MRLTVLTGEQTASIHQAALDILDRIGVVLTHALGRDLLRGAGARIAHERIYLPPDLVARALSLCPSQVRVRGRGGAELVLGNGQLHWHNLGGARDIYDPVTGKRRPAAAQDVLDAARLLDALPSVTAVTPFFTPQDVPAAAMSLAMYRYTLAGTAKPIHGPGVHTAGEVRALARMAEVALGDPAEHMTMAISPLSPLTFPDDVVEATLQAARLAIPLGPLPCPIAGASAPVTLAGALAQQHAEILAMIVLAQLERPGLPMVYCGRLAFIDPRTALSVWGGPELGLASACTVQLAQHCALPVNVYGLSTNVHTMNIQNGYERAQNALLPALAGADELSGIGETGAGVISSYAQMVCDDEIAAGISWLRRQVAVDRDHLALDVIGAAMDGGHSFLDQPHTARHLRTGAIFMPVLADRRPWEEWERAGCDGLEQRAQARAEQLLATHHPPPLDARQERELDTILGLATQ